MATSFVEVLEPALCEGIVTSYDGEVGESRGIWEGQGRAVLDNGASYEGTFVSGLMHGDGKMIWPDGTIYQGNFDNGTVGDEAHTQQRLGFALTIPLFPPFLPHPQISGAGKYQWPDGTPLHPLSCASTRAHTPPLKPPPTQRAPTSAQ